VAPDMLVLPVPWRLLLLPLLLQLLQHCQIQRWKLLVLLLLCCCWAVAGASAQ